MFVASCAPCHGAAAKGRGPVAMALRKKPTDLTKLAKENGGKFSGAEVVKELHSIYQAPHGSLEMPGWRPIFSRSAPRAKRLALSG
jgi:mono/diheme cytochrome c family protein